ncbi:hypothetical protein MA16_Dca022893 [Dendrobium catenatum]|uniref:Uncharacterized protein n=1 Tax=Dendrobium catenatum TaxID=906689 RepID=A0A2I0VCP4_9ASPA|nr:hypothetical protein MA16_Dca022893 [Dendrobium catenatum]
MLAGARLGMKRCGLTRSRGRDAGRRGWDAMLDDVVKWTRCKQKRARGFQVVIPLLREVFGVIRPRPPDHRRGFVESPPIRCHLVSRASKMPPRQKPQQPIQEVREDIQREVALLQQRLARFEQRKATKNGDSRNLAPHASDIPFLRVSARDEQGSRGDGENKFGLHIFDQLPSPYEDIFEGSPRKSSSSLIESRFDGFEDSLLKSSSFPFYDEPRYDMYDDDISVEVLDIDQPAYDDDEGKMDGQPEPNVQPKLFIHNVPNKTSITLAIVDKKLHVKISSMAWIVKLLSSPLDG